MKPKVRDWSRGTGRPGGRADVIPSAWTALEGGFIRNANGEDTTSEAALTIADQMYVQFGVSSRQGTASQTTGQATVSTAVAVRRA